jgi:serine/threonine protein kinase
MPRKFFQLSVLSDKQKNLFSSSSSTHQGELFQLTLVSRNEGPGDVTVRLDFPQLAAVLEKFVEMVKPRSRKATTRTSAIAQQYNVLFQRVSSLSFLEQHNLFFQILSLKIYSTGSIILLDPFVVPSITTQILVTDLKQARSIAAVTSNELDQIQWLKEQQIEGYVFRDAKHRHTFGMVVNQGVVLCSNKFASVHLLEAWAPHLQSVALDLKPEKNGEDCILVCVKISKNVQGLKRLQKEATALQALQSTGRVVELHCPESTAMLLRRGILITRYHPIPPPQEHGCENELSLVELEETLEELALALVSVHTRGWAWLNLNHDHILFCPWKLDERDSKTNLSITGLENAIFNNRVRCIDSIFVSDPAWAPPEYNAFFPLSSSQAVCSSDPNLFLNLPFIASCVDMFAMGTLIYCYLARTSDPVQALKFASAREDLSVAFNKIIFDERKRIQSDSFLIDLAMDLVSKDARSRPTAQECLQRIREGRRNTSPKLESFTIEVPGRIHSETLKMIWPIFLVSRVITDPRDKSRETDNISVFAALETPAGKFVADYSGRHVNKEHLQWLRYLGLHTHAINDGEQGAYDGRRKLNGVFDTCFYVSNGKVTSILFLICTF